MALALGGILGAATSMQTSFGKQKSVKSFLHKMSKVGIQIKSRYEVNFSGLSDMTFFATSIETPGVRTNMATLSYAGKTVEVPINHEYDHDVNITMINDSSGYIYPKLVNLLVNGATEQMSSNGFSLGLRAIGDKHTNGMIMTLNGVRIKSVSGLSFGDSDNDVSTFTIGLWVRDFSIGSGNMSSVKGLIGAIKSLGS